MRRNVERVTSRVSIGVAAGMVARRHLGTRGCIGKHWKGERNAPEGDESKSRALPRLQWAERATKSLLDDVKQTALQERGAK
jgi:hypothetical protein